MTIYSTDADVLALAQVTFNARVIEVGEPPAAVSGRGISYQDVSAEVTEIRGGSGLQVGDVVQLGVPVVASSPWVVPEPDGRFGLDRSLFRPEAAFVAYALWEGDRWAALTVDIEAAYS
jgi:hypothetical protein